jgi:hypothetical protein
MITFPLYFCTHSVFWVRFSALPVVGLEQGPTSLVSTIGELVGRKSGGSGLKNREHGLRIPSRSPHGTLYPQNLALTSPTSRGRSVRIVHSRTPASELSYPFSFSCLFDHLHFSFINDIQIPRKTEINMQINMKAAYSQETKTNQHHHQTIKLATRQKI